MSAVVAVLVVPADGDPGGLLAAGRCGGAAPMVVPPMCRPDECDARGLIPAAACWRPHPVTGWKAFAGCALPLWWDGALVPEGWDRFYRALAREASSLVAHTPRYPRVSYVLADAETAVCVGLASRVVRLRRDANGRLAEVT